MLDLSLYVLDIVQNSITAGATEITVRLSRERKVLTFAVKDNGCGMSPEFLEKVLDPFTTTRTTRNVGLGLPFLKQLTEQTGGNLKIISTPNVGTSLTATFYPEHIDMVPLGDIAGTFMTLVQGSPDIHFVFARGIDAKTYTIDTDEMKEVLEGVPLNDPSVLSWLSEFINEQEEELR
ncbi:histidine kinase [Clostridia bacterium]|nr:histidine kinase [Clostridia bacterium]GHV31620.1 histidine kinase [Clostridia bacterium]